MKPSLMLLPLFFVGCDVSEPVAETSDIDFRAQQVGTDPEVCDDKCDPGPTDIHKSLVVTDPEILALFPLRRVLDQLINLSGSTNTADDMWAQWWASQRQRTGGDPAWDPFCDDNASTINGFAIQCPRAESQLEKVRPESHQPVALFNRFDLAPMDGANCGEYRIVYALNGGEKGAGGEYGGDIGGRNFIIFEGVLPNPDPDCGLAGCVQVAQFWQALSSEPDVNVRGKHLEEFYFDGTCDYEPVVKPEHYGLNCRGGEGYAGGCGQIRTNQFVQSPWTLKQFTLGQDSSGGGLELEVNSSPVAANSHESLWQSTHGLFPPFEADFLANQLSLLPTPDGVNQIAIDISPKWDAGESVAQPNPLPFVANDYLPDGVFSASINAQLLADGVPPTINVTDVAERATTQSCGGCHELSSVTWPPSLRFVHVDEASNLSPALLTEFLPHRKNILDNFLATTCGVACLGKDEQIVKSVFESQEANEKLFVPPDVQFDLISIEEFNRLEPKFDTLGGSRTH